MTRSSYHCLVLVAEFVLCALEPPDNTGRCQAAKCPAALLIAATQAATTAAKSLHKELTLVEHHLPSRLRRWHQRPHKDHHGHDSPWRHVVTSTLTFPAEKIPLRFLFLPLMYFHTYNTIVWEMVRQEQVVWFLKIVFTTSETLTLALWSTNQTWSHAMVSCESEDRFSNLTTCL